MATKPEVRARAKVAAGSDGSLPHASFMRRCVWVLAAGVWLFLFLSLASFNAADAPSHVVAVHNQPTANWCGPFGAAIAYWSYYVIGFGTWTMLACLAFFLGIAVTGRSVTQPVVRSVGLLIMAVACSCFHELLLPNVGVLTGAKAGLLPQLIVEQLTQRFNAVGSFLITLCGLGLGAVVAIDQVVLCIPRWSLTAIGMGKKAGGHMTKAASALVALRHSPQPAMAGVGMIDDADEDEPRPARAKVRKGKPIPSVIEEIEAEQRQVASESTVEGDVIATDDSAVELEAKPERQKLTPEELKQKIAKLPVRMAGAAKTIAKDEDIPREENFEGYSFPPLDLLMDPETNFTAKMEEYVREQARQLMDALQTYGIDGEVVGIDPGPVVTLYSVQLAPGTKVSKLTAIASDIARALRAQNIRIVANMVGKTAVGIEVPNQQKEKVLLKELMSGGKANGMNLPMFLGKDASGEPLVADLTRMPHMLIAGTTGSGKSVCINTILMSWLYTKRPDELKLVLVDPKMVEMSQFAEIPHLMAPVVTESAKAAAILEWAVEKMEERYELLKEAGVRDITGYNGLSDEEKFEVFQPSNDVERAKIPKKLPYIVFVIDELADLILTCKDAEHSIVRIAQKARAVGIHLILATQRPQANVVTGLIKSNMPCRVSFKVASGMDSRIVLDCKGAELLLGQGDMLFLTPHTSEVKRAQGTLVTDGETRKVTKFLKTVAAPTFERTLLVIRPAGEGEEGSGGGLSPAERDPLFDEAVRIMIESGRGSVSLLQRRLAIGYSRASRLVDQMGQAGILGEHKGSVAREVLITLEEWEQMKQLEEEAAKNGTVFGDSQDDEAMGDMSYEKDDDSPEIHTFDRDNEVPAEFDDEYRR